MISYLMNRDRFVKQTRIGNERKKERAGDYYRMDNRFILVYIIYIIIIYTKAIYSKRLWSQCTKILNVVLFTDCVL